MNISYPSSNITIYDSQKKGPTIVIMGGVHGNEVCGVEAIHWLRNDFFIKTPIVQGRCITIIANEHAIQNAVRYVKKDMNRIFSKKTLNLAEDSYEYTRAREIISFLEEADYMLDIHSTSSPSVPMTCNANTDRHIALAKTLPVNFITTGWTGSTTGIASDECVDNSGGIGITVECGEHSSKKALQTAKDCIVTFLRTLKVLGDTKEFTTDSLPEHVTLVKTIYANTDHFNFTLPLVESFVLVSKHQLFAKDGEKMIYADDDYYLVQPAKNIKKGDEACYLAKKGLMKEM